MHCGKIPKVRRFFVNLTLKGVVKVSALGHFKIFPSLRTSIEGCTSNILLL